MKEFKIIAVFLLLSTSLFAQKQEVVPFTLSDRDRIIRTEQKLEALSKSVDVRFDAQQKQLDNIFSLMLFLLGGIMGLIGFVIYDRKNLGSR